MKQIVFLLIFLLPNLLLGKPQKLGLPSLVKNEPEPSLAAKNETVDLSEKSTENSTNRVIKKGDLSQEQELDVPETQTTFTTTKAIVTSQSSENLASESKKNAIKSVDLNTDNSSNDNGVEQSRFNLTSVSNKPINSDDTKKLKLDHENDLEIEKEILEGDFGKRKKSKVKGRKGVETIIITSTSPIPPLVSYEKLHPRNNVKQVNGTLITLETTSTVTTTSSTSSTTARSSTSRLPSAEVPNSVIVPQQGKVHNVISKTPLEDNDNVDDPTPRTSLIVGLTFGLVLMSVVGFLLFKRIDAIKRRRSYRRMNDFLIDGMYNDL